MRTTQRLATLFAGVTLAVSATGCVGEPTEPSVRDIGQSAATASTLIVRGLTIKNQYEAMPSIDYDYIDYVSFTPDHATQEFIREATYNKQIDLVQYVEAVYPSPVGWQLITVQLSNDAVDLGSREYSLLFERVN